MCQNFAAKLNQIDVINPPISRINGRNYRNLQLSHTTPYIHGTSNYTETDCVSYEEECSDIYELPDGSYQLPLSIPKSYHHRIIGHMGSTLKKLETDTGCVIEIPKFQLDSDVVIVTGSTQRRILSVKNRIEIILESSPVVSEVTHFISIPILSPGITAGLREFKHRILGAAARGVEESIFQDPAKLHITVCALQLHSSEEILRACSIFNNRVPALMESCFDDRPVFVELKGANCMNDDSSDVHVVYADVEVVGRKNALQIFSDQVNSYVKQYG